MAAINSAPEHIFLMMFSSFPHGMFYQLYNVLYQRSSLSQYKKVYHKYIDIFNT